MGIGIMFEMSEMIVVLRDQPIHKPEHIALYVRVGIFIYRQSACRVPRKQYTDPVFGPWNMFLNLGRKLDHLFPVS